jgi:hypothetical protein
VEVGKTDRQFKSGGVDLSVPAAEVRQSVMLGDEQPNNDLPGVLLAVGHWEPICWYNMPSSDLLQCLLRHY